MFYYLVTGRFGYNVHCPGAGGWLTAKQETFAGKENTPTTKEVLKVVNNFIKQNESLEAYSFIFNSGLPTPKMNNLIRSLF